MALVIFDIDGTLLQTKLVTVPAVQRTFAAFALPVPDEALICSFIGHPVEEYLAWLASQCPPERAAEIVAATNRLELELVGSEGRLFPGVRKALTRLRVEDHVLAICSNGPDDYVDEVMMAHNLCALFPIVRTRGNRYDGKIAMVREIMGLVSARPAIVVGDRPDDIAAAHANGALAISVLYGFGSREECADADITVTSAREIPGAVRALAARP